MKHEVWDFREREESFRENAIRGLARRQKTISPRFLYDERGSWLFQKICELEEYYLTRRERELLPVIARGLKRHFRKHDPHRVIELGPGGTEKTQLVLEPFPEAAYLPVEISERALDETCASLADRVVQPVLGDFTRCLGALEGSLKDGEPSLVLFLGSTLGNLEEAQAICLLSECRRLLNGGLMAVGVDLTRDERTLRLAYDDHQGVTAQFNLNLLERMNRELGADFRVEEFSHGIRVLSSGEAVEMHLVSQSDQRISLCKSGISFSFAAGESIHTESSRKFSTESLENLLSQAGLNVVDLWRNDRGSQNYGVAAVA